MGDCLEGLGVIGCMVGLIIVGDGDANVQAARKVRHPGAARSAFRALFKEVDTLR